MSEHDALIERFLAAWSASDFAAELAATCAPDLHYEDPLTFKPLVGPAALAGHLGRLRTGAPDARLEATAPSLTNGRFVAAPARRRSGRSSGSARWPPGARRARRCAAARGARRAPPGRPAA